jgi:hypothetical protein
MENKIKQKDLLFFDINNKNILNDLNILTKNQEIEYLIVIDIFHFSCEKSEEEILNIFNIIKEYFNYDPNILYLIYHTQSQFEFIEKNENILDVLKSNKNIFLEEKISNISFTTGFFLARNISVYLFSNGISQLGNWVKLKDPLFEKNFKISELNYMRITIDYLLKEKKRKYEQNKIMANKNRLAKLLENSNDNSNNKNKNINKEKNSINSNNTESNININSNINIDTNTNKKMNSLEYLKNLTPNNNNINYKNQNDLLNENKSNKNNNKISNNNNNNKNINNHNLKEKDDYKFINKKRNNNNLKRENSNVNNNINNNNINNHKKTRQEEIEEYLSSYKFSTFLIKIKRYLENNPPKNFETLKNIINHFSEQNIISINNCFKDNTNINNNNIIIEIQDLSFFILKELLKSEFILNNKLFDLINSKIIFNLDELSSILNFNINSGWNNNNNIEENLQENKNEIDNNNNNKLIYVRNNQDIKFSFGEKSEEEYKNLIGKCKEICLFIKGVIYKVLNSINLTALEKLPTNPIKYKNYIFSYVNNQELFKICKKIPNIDYNNIVNVLSDGIILELNKNELVVFLSDRKIHYNLKEIEKEKFRLFNNKN